MNPEADNVHPAQRPTSPEFIQTMPDRVNRAYRVFLDPQLNRDISQLNPSEINSTNSLALQIINGAYLFEIGRTKPHGMPRPYDTDIDHDRYLVGSRITGLEDDEKITAALLNQGQLLEQHLPKPVLNLLMSGDTTFNDNRNTIRVFDCIDEKGRPTNYEFVQCHFESSGSSFDDRPCSNIYLLYIQKNSELSKSLRNENLDMRLFTFALRNASVAINPDSAVFLDTSLGDKSKPVEILDLTTPPPHQPYRWLTWGHHRIKANAKVSPTGCEVATFNTPEEFYDWAEHSYPAPRGNSSGDLPFRYLSYWPNAARQLGGKIQYNFKEVSAMLDGKI